MLNAGHNDHNADQNHEMSQISVRIDEISQMT
jgi:hypothetical protein